MKERTIMKNKAPHQTVWDKVPTKTVLGVPIAALRLKETPSVIASLIERNDKKKTFFYVDAHHFNIASKDSKYKRILQKATLVHVSGMGPILASRILGQSLPERTPTPDFIDEIFAIGERKKWSFYLLGGEEDVVRKAVERIKKEFPGIEIVGYHHGFFADDREIVSKINSVKPDIILVGMGTPKQERWIEENKNKINAKVFWAVGALFDILSGKRKRPPKWIQRIGMEWVYRMGQEPRRLWRRYLFGNIAFLFNVLQEKELSSRKSSR